MACAHLPKSSVVISPIWFALLDDHDVTNAGANTIVDNMWYINAARFSKEHFVADPRLRSRKMVSVTRRGDGHVSSLHGPKESSLLGSNPCWSKIKEAFEACKLAYLDHNTHSVGLYNHPSPS